MAEKTKKDDLKVTKGSASYDAKDIYVLEGLEPVRKRPGMYIGSTGVAGLHHLIWEIVDNSTDEAMAGFAKRVTVELLPGNKVSVTDDGRGMPVDMHKQTKKSALETIMTTLHAGGKFGGESYKVSGGLHGVGASVVNALSEWVKVEVERDGGIFTQEYVRGIPKYKVKRVGASKRHGTKVAFSPDPQIFPEIEFSDKTILDFLRQRAYLSKNIRIDFFDRRPVAPKAPVFYGFGFEGGLLSFVKYLSRGKNRLHEDIFYVEKEAEKMDIECAFLYVDDAKVQEMSFANNINTPEGGMHLTGFRSALTRSLNNYARAEGYLKEKEENLTADDVREGLIVVLSVKLREPQFEGQTKAKLGNPEARTATEAVISDALKDFLEKHPQEAKAIIGKVILSAKARLAARAARETVLRKGAFEGLTLPGKLADCISKNAADSELFIVEGDSAGGCFSGDTKVALADGRAVSFEELVAEGADGKKNYCYTIAPDGNIAIAPVTHPRRTKKNARVVEVILDNGEKIVCTPDHRFLLRDGTYREAKDLVMNDSLMPLYRQHSKLGQRITIEGYEMVFQPARNIWEFTHLLSDRYNLKSGVYSVSDGEQRHHKDFHKLNNNPDNLIRMTREDHFALHVQHADTYLHNPEVFAKLAALRRTPEFREKIRRAMLQPNMRAQLSKRAQQQWADPAYQEFMDERFMKFYNENAAYRENSKRQLNQAQRDHWSKEENIRAQAERVMLYFAAHPEKREERSVEAQQQWADVALRQWRAKKTKEQWTDGFRAQRRRAYNETYLRKALQTLRSIYDATGVFDQAAYNEVRSATNDKSLLRWDTVAKRYFEGDEVALRDAVINYNHKVVSVTRLEHSIDVYDIEVPETHNFALASGVFVHNSSKQGRDRQTQAILPLRGKILNVERARMDRMLANAEVRALVVAMGTAIGEEFNMEKLRYHKIVIMTDADVDGAHIRTLLLTLFYRYFKAVIEGGFVYIAQPPLYKVSLGKKSQYAYSDDEKDKVIGEFQKADAAGKGKKEEGKKKKGTGAGANADADDDDAAAMSADEEITAAGEEIAATVAGKVRMPDVQRYKGLGEMNADELWETTMNPERRMMLQVTIDDAEKADKLFDTLMGDAVEPRKNFIQAHAATVKNIDLVA